MRASAAPAARPPVHCLMGPTGAGKTGLAVWLAARLPIEIVSVDSALVYRGMDIGTAKPDPGTRRHAPHHLLDLCGPAEPYSVARFCMDAAAAVADIEARGRIPLLVGGTGLYFRRFEQGIADMPAVPEAVRQALGDALTREGAPALHARLARVDAASAERIHPNDPQRILRALGVFEASGQPMSHYLATPQAQAQRQFRKWVLAPPTRDGLRAGWKDRFHQMLECGLVNEVAHLRATPGVSLACPALRAVGYREVWQYLEGELDHAAMVERSITATAQFAKRQYTWFRGEQVEGWLDPTVPATREILIKALAEAANRARD